MNVKRLISTFILLALWLSVAVQHGQAQQPASAPIKLDNSSDASRTINLSHFIARMWRVRRPGFDLLPPSRYASENRIAAAPLAPSAVLGAGTVGKISMWTGTGPSGNSILGDSIITQAGGNIGIGIPAPTSKLAVQGMIETTLGGYKFPDGTVQTTAGLTEIFHDSTLAGDGTAGSPLGITVPLALTGSVPTLFSPNFFAGIIQATNTAEGGIGVYAVGGRGTSEDGGSGLWTRGGDSEHRIGGTGVFAFGGNSLDDDGGPGVLSIGGNSATRDGGAGVYASGGSRFGIGVVANGGTGGNQGFIGAVRLGLDSAGVVATGGAALLSGGTGVIAKGGLASGSGRISGDGLWAESGDFADGADQGAAAIFNGRVFSGELWVNGNLTVSAGSFTVRGTGTKDFKIDHPLDPENKYLVHAAIESSEVLNVYSGNVTTNERGEAMVTLPEWFEALNKDFRYQLTVLGTFAQAIVAEKVKQNRFRIRTSAPKVEVSWQVTGVRSDAGMQKHPFKAVEIKPESERGTYLDPGAYNQPEERGVEWARNPAMMRRMKESRARQVEPSKQKPRTNDR